MPEEGKITYKQLIMLFFISRLIIALTYLPGLLTPPANQDLWLSELIEFPFHLLISIPIYFLWKRFPNQSIIQYSVTVLGKAGILIGFLYIWFFMHVIAITISQFNVFITTSAMSETPVLFFTIILVLFCAYAAIKGIEVLGRLSEIIAPIIMIAIVTIFLLLVKDMDLKVFLPIAEKGFPPIIFSSFASTARTIEVLGLAMVLPCLNERKKAKTVFILSFLSSIIYFVLITAPIIAALGLEGAKKSTFPYFSTVRLVQVGGFIERIESIHLAIWILGFFVKISFYYYLSVIAIKQLFNFKNYKNLVIPVGTVLVPLSILTAGNIVELREFTNYKVFPWYALFYIVVIPAFILIIAIITRKGVRSK